MSNEKLVNFRMDDDEYQELKMLALKERIAVKALLSDLIKDYLKKHGDGNPQFTMDQFEDPNFLACPAFYRDSNAWKNYLSKQDTSELMKVKSQILLIEKHMMRYL